MLPTFRLPRSRTPPLAFDTGPGNILIDHMMTFISDGKLTYDADGGLAAQGTVDEPLLAALLQEPYLAQPPPKTTGRELFTEAYARRILKQGRKRGLGDADLVATTTAFTARSIAHAYRDFLPLIPEEVLVSGGGAFNRTLLAMLATALPDSTVSMVEDAGIAADAKEAVAFALIAYETFHGRPGKLTRCDRSTPTGCNGEHYTRPVNGSIQIGAATMTMTTESRNPATNEIDRVSTLEMVRIINREDAGVAAAVGAEADVIAAAIDAVAARMQQGGRLIYVGAGYIGTVGRSRCIGVPTDL